jgi:DOPA 4,5-dioxygenase
MDQPDAQGEAVGGFHAHIYYTLETKPVAARIREEIDRRFTATLGRWHDTPVGPHSAAMYQVAFATAEFARLVPWLMLHRNELSIFVHPLTGDDYADHATFSLWLGPALPLRLEVLKHCTRDGDDD